VIIPDGPLVDEDSEEFLSTLTKHLASANPRLVICMQDVPYLDSYGLEMLLDYANDLREHSQRLKLASVTSTCREIMDLTELMGEFEIFDDVEDAVRSFL